METEEEDFLQATLAKKRAELKAVADARRKEVRRKVERQKLLDEIEQLKVDNDFFRAFYDAVAEVNPTHFSEWVVGAARESGVTFTDEELQQLQSVSPSTTQSFNGETAPETAVLHHHAGESYGV